MYEYDSTGGRKKKILATKYHSWGTRPNVLHSELSGKLAGMAGGTAKIHPSSFGLKADRLGHSKHFAK